MYRTYIIIIIIILLTFILLNIYITDKIKSNEPEYVLKIKLDNIVDKNTILDWFLIKVVILCSDDDADTFFAKRIVNNLYNPYINREYTRYGISLHLTSNENKKIFNTGIESFFKNDTNKYDVIIFERCPYNIFKEGILKEITKNYCSSSWIVMNFITDVSNILNNSKEDNKSNHIYTTYKSVIYNRNEKLYSEYKKINISSFTLGKSIFFAFRMI